MLVVCNAGELLMLDAIFAGLGNLSLRLYTNNYTPIATSATGNFTEAAYSGYAAKTLTNAGWGASATNGSGQAVKTYGTVQTFSSSSTVTVYGYYVTNAGGGLVWAERFASPRTIETGADLQIAPTFTAYSEF